MKDIASDLRLLAQCKKAEGEVSLAKQKLDLANGQAEKARQLLMKECSHSLFVHCLGYVKAEYDEGAYSVQVSFPLRICVFCGFSEEQVVSRPSRQRFGDEARKRLVGNSGPTYHEADCSDLSDQLGALPQFFEVLVGKPEVIAEHGYDLSGLRKQLLAKAEEETSKTVED